MEADNCLHRGWESKLSEILAQPERFEIDWDSSSSRKSLSRSNKSKQTQNDKEFTLDGEEDVANPSNDGIIASLSRAVDSAKRESVEAGRQVARMGEQVSQVVRAVTNSNETREADRECIRSIESHLRQLERWREHCQVQLDLAKEAAEEGRAAAFAVKNGGNTVTRAVLFGALGEAMEDLREEVQLRMREHASEIVQAQNQAALAAAMAQETRTVTQDQGNSKLTNNSDKETKRLEQELKSWMTEGLHCLEAKLGEKIACVDKDASWKLMQETRSLERRVLECQSQLFTYVANHGSGSRQDSSAVRSPAPSSIDACQPPIAPASFTSQPEHFSQVIQMVDKLTKRVDQLEGEQRRHDNNQDKNRDDLATREKELAASTERLVEEKVSAAVGRLESQLTATIKSKLKTQLKDELKHELETEIKKDLSAELKNKIAAQIAALGVDCLPSDFEELESSQRKLSIAVSKQSVSLAEFEAARPGLQEGIDSTLERLAKLELELKSIESRAAAALTTKEHVERNDRRKEESQVIALSEELDKLRNKQAQLEEENSALKTSCTAIEKRLQLSETKQTRDLNDAAARLGRLERATASANVQQKAQTELDEARQRAMYKSLCKTNSAAMSPPTVTTVTATSNSNATAPKQGNTSASAASVKYSIPSTTGTPPTNGARRTGGGGSKTAEQIEREEKRQEELANVRLRLAAFEAKWKQQQQQRGAGGKQGLRHQPPPPKTPPPAHLIGKGAKVPAAGDDIINEEIDISGQARPSTAPATSKVGDDMNDDLSEVSEKDNDDDDDADADDNEARSIDSYEDDNDDEDEEEEEEEDDEDEEEYEEENEKSDDCISNGEDHDGLDDNDEEDDDEEQQQEEEECDSEARQGDSKSIVDKAQENETKDGQDGLRAPPATLKQQPPNTPATVPKPRITISGTIECSYCKRVLPGKNTAALHEKVCDKRPRDNAGNVKDQLITCDYCDEDFSANEIQVHKAKCDWLPSKCSHCHMNIILRDIEKHESRCSKNPNRTNVASPMQSPMNATKSTSQEQHFEQWDNARVIAWVSSIDGINATCVDSFKSLAITGATLAKFSLSDLDSQAQVKSALDRKQIWLALAELRRKHNDAKRGASDVIKALLRQAI